jgi:hypothetical protein
MNTFDATEYPRLRRASPMLDVPSERGVRLMPCGDKPAADRGVPDRWRQSWSTRFPGDSPANTGFLGLPGAQRELRRRRKNR